MNLLQEYLDATAEQQQANDRVQKALRAIYDALSRGDIEGEAHYCIGSSVIYLGHFESPKVELVTRQLIIA